MTSRRLSVYEALNRERKEIFVGVTVRPLRELIEAPGKVLSGEISHWEPAEAVAIRGVSEEMPAADAWEFAGIYVSYIERDGWTIILQRHEG